MPDPDTQFRALVLTHVFPRSADDSLGAFLLHLADALAACGIATDVLAPHEKKLRDEEMLGAARVQRFHYAPARLERLAYTGAMHELFARGLTNKILFGFFCIAFLFKTLSAIRALRPAILHAHWWLPGGIVGALASMLTRVPLIVTTHGTDVEMLRRTCWALPLARFVFRRARAITCGSNYLREQLLELRVADESRVSVVPMPVAAEFIIHNSKFVSTNYDPSTTLRTGLRITNLILTVTRLTEQKDIATLIRAFALLTERTARLIIIGDGPTRAALEQLARELNVGDRVEFLGALAQKELPRYYAECAVFALPSLREGMGLVFAEALLCGAPVIAANSGGVTDIVQDGETGLLVPERDAAALAVAIEKLLNDRALASRLAQNGAAFVRERFSATRVAAQFAQVYRNSVT